MKSGLLNFQVSDKIPVLHLSPINPGRAHTDVFVSCLVECAVSSLTRWWTSTFGGISCPEEKLM